MSQVETDRADRTGDPAEEGPPVRWVAVAHVDELWEGDLLDVEVEGEQVMLAHLLGGRMLAYQGMCPHQEILLADGTWDADANRLLCGGHNWEFDLTTGEGVNPTGCRLFEYPVRVVADEIVVGVPQDGQRHHNRHQT